MSVRYEPIERWLVPRSAIKATLTGVLRAAIDRHEGGVFWLGTRGVVAEVHAVALLEGAGVTEERGFWEVSPLAYGVVGEWSISRKQVLLAVVHSHEGRRETRLSALDRRGGVHVPDTLAVVVPGFGSVHDPQQWGFHRFGHQGFTELGSHERRARIELTDSDVTILRASEAGIIYV